MTETEIAARPAARGLGGWRALLWAPILLILLLPAVAMRFTSEVNWTTLDFLFAGGLLIGAGLAYEIAAWNLRRPRSRLIAGMVILAVVLVVWADGAVGLF